MNCIDNPYRSECATIIESNLHDVLDELRTIDLIDLVTYIHLDSLNTIEDLLSSSTELFFKEGTLTFAWLADVDLEWGLLPTVRLGMEFHHAAVSVFFTLSLRAFDQAIDVDGIQIDGKPWDGQAPVSRVADALADARLMKRPTLSSPAKTIRGGDSLLRP